MHIWWDTHTGWCWVGVRGGGGLRAIVEDIDLLHIIILLHLVFVVRVRLYSLFE